MIFSEFTFTNQDQNGVTDGKGAMPEKLFAPGYNVFNGQEIVGQLENYRSE